MEQLDVRRERRDHAIQSPLGHPTPGADSIGNHLYGERRFNARRRPEVIQAAGVHPLTPRSPSKTSLMPRSIQPCKLQA